MNEQSKIIGRCGDYIDYRVDILETIECIRKRPGMYIGSTGSRGLHQLIEELLAFSLSNNSKNIEITLHDNNVISYCDRDYSIPLDILETVLTESLNSQITKFYTQGIIIINALSEMLEVSVCQEDKIYYQRYEKGKAISKIEEKLNKEYSQGSLIIFKPDKTVFKEATVNPTILKLRLQQLAYLYPNLRIELKNKIDNTNKSDHFNYSKGISEYLLEINQSASLINNEVIYIQKEQNNLSFEVALLWHIVPEDYLLKTFIGVLSYQRQWEVERKKREQIENSLHLMSFVNRKYTPDNGTHVEGVKQGIILGIRMVIEKCNILQEINLDWQKISKGLTGIISINLNEPEFAGATKRKLINPEVTDIISKSTSSVLAEYLEQHPEIIKKLI